MITRIKCSKCWNYFDETHFISKRGNQLTAACKTCRAKEREYVRSRKTGTVGLWTEEDKASADIVRAGKFWDQQMFKILGKRSRGEAERDFK